MLQKHLGLRSHLALRVSIFHFLSEYALSLSYRMVARQKPPCQSLSTWAIYLTSVLLELAHTSLHITKKKKIFFYNFYISYTSDSRVKLNSHTYWEGAITYCAISSKTTSSIIFYVKTWNKNVARQKPPWCLWLNERLIMQ